MLLLAPVFLGANVKLRIYLKDGSLQAGNLVKEDETQFIVLTKEGRVEILKTNIMFVNGKTLSQWNARPDKNYSTEILPSDVPDRAYINDKAALPPPVELPAITRKPVVEEIKPVEQAAPVEDVRPEVARNEEPIDLIRDAANAQAFKEIKAKKAAKEKPKPAEEKVAAAPVEPPPAKMVIPVAETPRPKKKRVRPVVTAAAPAGAAPVVETPSEVKAAETMSVAAPVRRSLRVGKFDREGYAINHYNVAMQYMEQGERGRAAQELHIAHTLNKWDEKTALALGTFYKDAGVIPRARKYLDLPALRKKPEIQAMQAEMTKIEQWRAYWPWIYAGSFLGAFIVSLLGIALLRRTRKPTAPPPLVVTSENIDEIAEQLEVPEPLPTIVPMKDTIVAGPMFAAKDEKPVQKPVSAFDDVFKVEKPEPLAPKPFIQPLPQEPVSQPPLAKPNEPLKPFEPMREPLKLEPPKRVEPVRPAEPVKIPIPEPVAAAPVAERAELARPYERILETERVVSESLVRGNKLAAEGNIEMARREYRTAAALNMANVDAQLGLAYLCFLQEQWELSMQHYLNALQINPRSADAHYGLGRILLELGRVNDAIPEVRKALELDPTLFDAQETLTSLGQLA